MHLTKIRNLTFRNLSNTKLFTSIYRLFFLSVKELNYNKFIKLIQMNQMSVCSTLNHTTKVSVELDFAKICRICLKEGVMMSIFKVNVSKKIMACASIQVVNVSFINIRKKEINLIFILNVGLAKR